MELRCYNYNLENFYLILEIVDGDKWSYLLFIFFNLFSNYKDYAIVTLTDGEDHGRLHFVKLDIIFLVRNRLLYSGFSSGM